MGVLGGTSSYKVQRLIEESDAASCHGFYELYPSGCQNRDRRDGVANQRSGKPCAVFEGASCEHIEQMSG